MGVCQIGTRRIGLHSPVGLGSITLILDGGITYVRSGDIWYRKLIRDDMYCIDKSEDGGVTWELDLARLHPDEDNIIINIDSGVDGYRQVVRDGALCIDVELTATGFSGAEDVDWENVIKIDTP